MSQETTLDKGWEDACLAFHRAAGIDLKTQAAPTADTIRAQYEDKKVQTQEDRRKSEKIKEIFNKTMTCIDRIGGIAAQGASMVFGSPASIAGSALSFFIAAGVAYRQIFGDIEDLLGQIVVIFERFQVYRDDQGILPPQMIHVANKLLVTLVQICGLCYQTLRKHRLKTFLNMTLFGDDNGVRSQLAKLQTIQAEEGQMRGTLTLVATEKTRRSVETGFAHTATQLETLESSMQTMQTRMEIREDLKYLAQTLDIQQKDLSTDEHRRCVAELSSESCKWLRDDHTYQSWSDPQGKVDMVVLAGEEGVGKTYAVTAILQDLENRYSLNQETTLHVSVAYCYITESDKREKLLSMSDVIRSFAWQLAQNNPTYRQRLVNTCRQYAGQSESTIKILQRMIIDCSGDGSIVFLVMDGVQNLSTDSHTQLRIIIRALTPVVRSSSIKMLLSARQEFAQELASTIPTLATLDLAEKGYEDMRQHIATQLNSMKIFRKQGDSTDNLKRLVSDNLSQGVQGNFLYANALLGEIECAYDSSEITAIVERVKQGGLLSDSIRVAIGKHNQSLSAKELEDLNTILLWTLYSAETVTVGVLENVLYLKNGEPPLRSIYDQVKEQFSDLLVIEHKSIDETPTAAVVRLRSDMVKDYLMNMSHEASQSSAGAATKREIRMLRNIVEKFCDEDLYDVLGFAAFFEQKLSDTATSVTVDTENANASIAVQCLQALLDERKELPSLRVYAYRNLEVHLRDLASAGNHVRTEVDIGPLLVRYLIDIPYIARASIPTPNLRLSFQDDMVEDIVRLLRNETVMKNVMATQSDDRRWVLSIQKSSCPEIDLLMPAAKVMSRALTTVKFGNRGMKSDLPYYLHAFQWLSGLFNKCQHSKSQLQYARTAGLRREYMIAPGNWRSMDELSIKTIHEVFDFAHELLNGESLSFESLSVETIFRLAQIYGDCDHRTAAIAKLEQCLSIQPNNTDVMAELVSILVPENGRAELEDCRVALRYLTYIMKEEENSGTADEPSSFSQLYESHLIKLHLELQQYDEVENIYTEKLSKGHHPIHWTRQLMLLAHKREHHAKVMELLQTYSSQNDIAELSSFFLDLAYGCDFEYAGDSFEAVAHSFKLRDKLSCLQDMCRKVLESATRPDNVSKWSFLLSYDQLRTYLAQTYYEYPTMSEDVDHAVRLWEEIVVQNRSSEFIESPARVSARFLVPAYVQQIMRAGKGTPIFKEVITKIEALEVVAEETDDLRGTSKAMFRATLCRCYMAVDDISAARLAVRRDVHASLELLSDNDLQNDWLGYRKLGYVFMGLDDDENAVAAWRMIGPTPGLSTHRERALATGEEESGGQESSFEVKDPVTSTSVNDNSEAQRDEDGAATPSPTKKVQGPLDGYYCHGSCSKRWTFADNIWMCCTCVNTCLDSRCIEKFQAGSWRPSGCNFQHRYLHIPPWDAACTERLEAKLVLVGDKATPLVQWLLGIYKLWLEEEARHDMVMQTEFPADFANLAD